MSRRGLVRPFALSVLLGSLAGAAPFLAVSFLLSLLGLGRALSDPREFMAMLMLLAIPLAVSLPILCGASIAIGLPLTSTLQRRNLESGVAYAGVGTIAGAAVALLLVHIIDIYDGSWLAILGAVSGGVTGTSWWKFGRQPLLRAAVTGRSAG